MASIEAMTKEASRSLSIRVKRQEAAEKELTAAQDMDNRAVARLDAAQKASTDLTAEVAEKAELVSRLTGKSVDEILSDIRTELDAQKAAKDAENAGVSEDGTPVDSPAAKTSKSKPKPVVDAPQG